MSFRDLTFPDVLDRLNLTLSSDDLFPDVGPAPLTPSFLEHLEEGRPIAEGSNNETARARFVVAPTLIEFHCLTDRRHGVFSGLDFDVDPPSGLSGPCGLLSTRNRHLDPPASPVAIAIEVENGTANFRLGPCIAAMRAAWLFNGSDAGVVHGVVTTGGTWRFLRLRDRELTIDRREHYVTEIGRILGVLCLMATA